MNKTYRVWVGPWCNDKKVKLALDKCRGWVVVRGFKEFIVVAQANVPRLCVIDITFFRHFMQRSKVSLDITHTTSLTDDLFWTMDSVWVACLSLKSSLIASTRGWLQDVDLRLLSVFNLVATSCKSRWNSIAVIKIFTYRLFFLQR